MFGLSTVPSRQDRIIAFLEELKAFSRHDVPDGVLPGPENPVESFPSITLWPIQGTWEGIPEIFRVEILGMLPFPFFTSGDCN